MTGDLPNRPTACAMCGGPAQPDDPTREVAQRNTVNASRTWRVCQPCTRVDHLTARKGRDAGEALRLSMITGQLVTANAPGVSEFCAHEFERAPYAQTVHARPTDRPGTPWGHMGSGYAEGVARLLSKWVSQFTEDRPPIGPCCDMCGRTHDRRGNWATKAHGARAGFSRCADCQDIKTEADRRQVFSDDVFAWAAGGGDVNVTAPRDLSQRARWFPACESKERVPDRRLPWAYLPRRVASTLTAAVHPPAPTHPARAPSRSVQRPAAMWWSGEYGG